MPHDTMNPHVPRLNLVQRDHIATTNFQRVQSNHAHTLTRQASDLTFSVNIDTTGEASPHIPSAGEESLAIDEPQRFQHAQDSFRLLLHRKSSVPNKDAVRTGRRHTVTEPPVLMRRETSRPRSLFDAEDSARGIARRLTLQRLGDARRWTLPTNIKAPIRVYVASTSTSEHSRQSQPQTSESCAIL